MNKRLESEFQIKTNIFSSCGSVHVEPPCVLESDLSLPYPACCPRPKCVESVDILDDSNSNDISRQKVGAEHDNETIVQYDVTLDDDKSAVNFQEVFLNNLNLKSLNIVNHNFRFSIFSWLILKTYLQL